MAKNNLVSPFLKWVGGKRQIMSVIVDMLPKDINKLNYIEPFIGGGALLFHLQPKIAVVNDFNAELINVYEVIKSNLDELLIDLQKHKNEAEYFYFLRGLDRTGEFQKLSNVQRASRVIYLNKTCFNGLYRVNNAGEFNAPFGRYKNPNIVNAPTLKAVSKYLNTNDVSLITGDYAPVLNNISKNSFVYLDPPYHPLTDGSSFTGYIQGGWNVYDQIRLREVCDDLDKKGIKFLLSNSSTDFIKEQYRAYEINIVRANRSINSNGEKRGEVEEVLIRNYRNDKK